MTRKKNAPSHRKRKKKTMKAVKGQFSARSRLYRTAKEAARKSLQESYFGRKNKKRTFRRLWITRISAACKQEGLSYSRFICGLKNNNIDLNRKVLADIAASDTEGFKTLVEKVKSS